MLTLEPESLCDVCIEEFGPSNIPYCIPCGHVLCLSCCTKILDTTPPSLVPTCPFCREQFSRDTVRPIRIDLNHVTPTQAHRQRKTSNTTEVDRGGARGTNSPGTLGKASLFAYIVLYVAGWTLVLYRTLTHLPSGHVPSSSPLSFLAFSKKPVR